MHFFNILSELFESDSYRFLLVGIILALMGGYRAPEKALRRGIIWVAVYIICEYLMLIPGNYLIEILALIFGTLALGISLGFFGMAVVYRLSRRK